MTQPTEQQGNQPESAEQPVYQPAPAWAPQFSAAAPQFPTAVPQQPVSQQPMAMPPFAQSPMSVPEQAAYPHQPQQPGPVYASPYPYPNRAMAQPNQPSVAQERFGRSSGRLTASQVIETCATILAGVILLGLAWTNPQPYAPVDLIAGLSGAAALIVGVRLPQVRPMLRSWPALWLALGGIILIVAAARYEASLKSMRTIAARIGDLR